MRIDRLRCVNFMRMLVICGNEDCRAEFAADTVNPFWKCPECEREIENRFFPFLSARIMEARIRPEKADWKRLYTEHLTVIEDFVGQKTGRIREFDKDFEMDEDHSIEEFRGFADDAIYDQEMFDRLLKRGHGTAVYLIRILRDRIP